MLSEFYRMRLFDCDIWLYRRHVATSGCTVGMMLIEHNVLPCLSVSLPVQLPLRHFTFISHGFIQVLKEFI